MKTIKKQTLLMAFMLSIGISIYAQFEEDKLNPEDFKDLKVKVGADFALQYQGISHEADVELIDLKKNINLPTANMDIIADLAPGIRLTMNTFLSSRHHNEAWVEGGYLLIDYLPFLPAANKIMKYVSIKAGVMMPDYGDAHFFRSTNAAVTKNPFVGNWIMDAYTTNPGMEITFRKNGILAVVGANNGRMNYGRGGDLAEDLVFNWKLGYDTHLNENVRLRATLSGFHVGEGHSGATLWDGDRAGARYYNVMQLYDATTPSNNTADANFRSGRWSPGANQTEMNTYMANLYFEVNDLQLFGIYETMKGAKGTTDQEFSQLAAQAIYHIGDLYVGGRWNKVEDKLSNSTVERYNLGGGWNMLKYVVVKLDYVNQKYEGFAHGAIDGGTFNGVVIEAAISF
jgi:hypothetical protein